MRRIFVTTAVLLIASVAETQQYTGVASCIHSGCHGSTEPLGTTRVLQNEYYTWLNHDRHSGTWNMLFSERSARIARNMRLRKPAWEETICLDCHTTNVAAQRVAGKIDVEDGVQCEACHGPASGWRDGHAEAGWTHERSVAAGMIDLRDLTRRAALCSGCHVGDARREVDHEMIASGHPLLTFELDNYTASMPPHWKPSGDGVSAWAVGQIVTFRQSLANLARHAGGEKWPEFSDMNCTSCHHSLGGSGWRQERGWSGRAGLPPWSAQRWPVLRLIVGDPQLDPLMRELARVVAAMNDPKGVVNAATRAEQALAAVQPRIAAARWNEAEIRLLMRALAAGDVPLDDARTAEQVAFALQSLSAALTRRDARLLRSPMIRSIDALFDELQKPEDYDPRRFAARLRAVHESL